jgi:hypothetical protein
MKPVDKIGDVIVYEILSHKRWAEECPGMCSKHEPVPKEKPVKLLFELTNDIPVKGWYVKHARQLEDWGLSGEAAITALVREFRETFSDTGATVFPGQFLRWLKQKPDLDLYRALSPAPVTSTPQQVSVQQELPKTGAAMSKKAKAPVNPFSSTSLPINTGNSDLFDSKRLDNLIQRIYTRCGETIPFNAECKAVLKSLFSEYSDVDLVDGFMQYRNDRLQEERPASKTYLTKDFAPCARDYAEKAKVDQEKRAKEAVLVEATYARLQKETEDARLEFERKQKEEEDLEADSPFAGMFEIRPVKLSVGYCSRTISDMAPEP